MIINHIKSVSNQYSISNKSDWNPLGISIKSLWNLYRIGIKLVWHPLEISIKSGEPHIKSPWIQYQISIK